MNQPRFPTLSWVMQPAGVTHLPRRHSPQARLSCHPLWPEAFMEVFLLNMMGSAAVASAVIAGVMSTRLSREIARSCDSRPEPPKPNGRAIN